MFTTKNIRISQKIMLLVAGLALGFAAIGVAYFVQMSTETALREQRAQVAQSQTLLSETRLNVVELNRLLLQFMLQRDPALLAAQEELRQDLRAKLNALATQSATFGLSQDLQAIESLLASYSQQYEQTVSQFERLGGDTTTGLRQALVLAAQDLGARIEPLNDAEITAQYLQLRRFESDFMRSRTSESLARIDQATSQLLSAIVQSNLTPEQVSVMKSTIDSYMAAVDAFAAASLQVASSERALQAIADQISLAMGQAMTRLNDYAQAFAQSAERKSQIAMATFIGLSFTVVMAVAVGVFLIYKSIVFPMAHIQNVIRRINRGNLKARVRLLRDDELGDLGRAFNLLLDERIQNLEEQSLENEQLNNSIISLIRALGAIAQKNLTIKVPVSADITGTISDAVNLLTTETAKTLAQVKDISEQVNAVSDRLQIQSSQVVRVAEDERKHVIATSKALDLSARAMNEIAARAETADTIASKTIADTQQARAAVLKTVNGIQTIRETISETEKRMKRLGDRSQEISGIVNLINTIAERTHILALNASMHAASAGEAGKGFAVVADEVQRLAENAREATAEISAMVNSIRVETSDTVSIMNKLITDVAEGTRLAEQADKNMKVTEDATRQLVETVQAISHSSVQQAQLANKIRDRANIIRNFTEKTGTELAQQKQHTDSLKHFAVVLLERVNVFELPEGLSSAPFGLEVDRVEALPSGEIKKVS